MKRFAAVAKEMGDDTESYAFGYEFPEIFSQLYPFDLDAEFYHPFIGMGVVNNIINEFFNKYVQKFPAKIQDIIDRYPRDFKGERFQLSDWIEDTTTTSTTNSTIENGQYKFLGFIDVDVKRVSFTYTNANNNAPPVTVVCVYDHHEDGGKLRKIQFKIKKEKFMEFSVWAYGEKPEVKAEKITDFGYTKDLNNVLLGINCIWQDLDNPE